MKGVLASGYRLYTSLYLQKYSTLCGPQLLMDCDPREEVLWSTGADKEPQICNHTPLFPPIRACADFQITHDMVHYLFVPRPRDGATRPLVVKKHSLVHSVHQMDLSIDDPQLKWFCVHAFSEWMLQNLKTTKENMHGRLQSKHQFTCPSVLFHGGFWIANVLIPAKQNSGARVPQLAAKVSSFEARTC